MYPLTGSYHRATSLYVQSFSSNQSRRLDLLMTGDELEPTQLLRVVQTLEVVLLLCHAGRPRLLLLRNTPHQLLPIHKAS